MAWEMRTSAEANSSDPYRPKTVEEKAGCPGGTGMATASEVNFVFARTMKAGREKTAYPIGLPGDITTSDMLVPVDTNNTLVLP